MHLTTFYRFGNREICSEIPLIALNESTIRQQGSSIISITQSTANVMPRVRRWLHRWVDGGNITLSLARRDEGFLLRFPRLCDLHINSVGNSIHVLRREGIEDHTLEHLLVDQVLPRLLAHQGELIAHASALVVDGRTILFLGPSGAGKSTLAALMRRAGHQVLSDDCTLLQFQDEMVTAFPTYPSLRLLPDSLEHAVPASTATTAMARYSSKRRVHVGGTLDVPTRVDAVYLLAPVAGHTAPSIHARSSAAACMDLIRHSFQLDVTDRNRVAALLECCGATARQVPAFTLSFSHAFDTSDALVAEISRHIQTLPLRLNLSAGSRH